MDGQPHDILLILVAALAAALAAALIGWWLSAGRAGRASRARNHGAIAGERDAEELLESLGYRVVERQVRAVWWIEVDGDEVEVEVRADLLVEWEDGDGERQRFVAEVKTGRLAPDPGYPPTRRQLLEYAHVFAPCGVLLVDVDAGDVREVSFPITPTVKG